MSGEIIDGREATLKARQYFVETHGSNAVIAFEVKDVVYDEKDLTWKVSCGFFSSYMSLIKSFYDVTVDSKGRIMKVTKIPPPEGYH